MSCNRKCVAILQCSILLTPKPTPLRLSCHFFIMVFYIDIKLDLFNSDSSTPSTILDHLIHSIVYFPQSFLWIEISPLPQL